MKKTYMQPSITLTETVLVNFVCGSQDITSNKDITYGGVDEEGEKEPASRRTNVWDDEEEETE